MRRATRARLRESAVVIRNPALFAGVDAATAPAWCEVDLDALRHNVGVLRGGLAPATELWAVVKADAYGHGAVPCARAALAAGASRLVVATLAELLHLRAARVRARVLVLGPLQAGDVEPLLAGAGTPCIADLDLARSLSAATAAPLPVQVKIDTGMGRHGVPATDAVTFCRAVAALPGLRLEGVLTHFTARAAEDLPAMRRQLAALLAVRDGLAEHGLRPALHAANTLGAMVLPAARLDAVRAGGGLYGFDPLARGDGSPLRPVLALKTRIAALKPAPAGTAVGYGGTHRCRRDTVLAVLPLGYADGLLRESWRGGPVLVRGTRAPIVGLINMNQTVVDVGHLPAVAVGDEVVLLGAQGRERIRAEDRVGPDGSVYQVTCALPPRLPRIGAKGDGAAMPRRTGFRAGRRGLA